MQTETDIPVVTTGVMVITVLMPAVRSLMSPHLQDIFAVFSRLTAFNEKKPGELITTVEYYVVQKS